MRRVAGAGGGVVLAVGLAVALLTPAAASAGGPPPAQPIDRVITLGDSYSAGTGIHRDASDYDDHGPLAHSFQAATRLGDSMCLRELDTIPGARVAASLGATSIVIACAGARIADVEHQLTAASVPGDGTGTLVTMTIGGNDVRTRGGRGWTDVLLDCVVSFGCHREDDNQVGNLGVVGDDLAQLFASITEAHPQVTLRVLGYPRPMQPDRWGCVGVTGVGRAEARWIDEQVDSVNEVLAAAAESVRAASDADVEFVAVEDEFDNHGACRVWQRDRYVNDAIWGETSSRVLGDDGEIVERRHDGPLTLSAASFHPSQAGYDAFEEALRASTRPAS